RRHWTCRRAAVSGLRARCSASAAATSSPSRPRPRRERERERERPRARREDAGRIGGRRMRTRISGALLVALTVLLVSGCAGSGTQAAKPLPPAKALQPTDLA